ncbi:ribosomal protein L32 [Sporomusaceae bacterium BoRhaA]|uniref:flagellar protein n=1 Tax=Pelorhabdus rhamnosifermentans TaxID=2772457 RepID=UPI001C05F636|nr:flagellar protein [Pelorhabdus rhamnosifermentans]MBU2699141.1 ribosomal protein L32 [Pelorhabdus rhamnosifermentans]
MGLANCQQCGKLYMENEFGICVDCIRLQQEDEAKVGAYLRDVVDHASVAEIHEATGVKERVIMRMIRQGRIIGGVKVFYACETCGAPIANGRLCEKCNQNIVSQMAHLEINNSADEKLKMATRGVRMYSKEKGTK